MKVVHLNTHDCIGGAARAAFRLHEGLRRAGEDSKMFVATKSSHDISVVQFTPSTKWSYRLLRTIRRARITWSAARSNQVQAPVHSLISDDRSPYSSEPWSQCPEVDLLHLHWVAGFLDYGNFFHFVPESTPLVWTLHDMNPFTGGCHYDMDCGRFVAQCGACPQLGSQKESDFSRDVWRRKARAYRLLSRNHLHLVTPSLWLGEQLSQSSLLSQFPHSVIPYGLDTEVFQPRSPFAMREVLGIPSDAKVILFIADGLNDPRKGFEFLVRALENVDFRFKTVVLSVGQGKPLDIQGLPHVHARSIQDDQILSFVYSCSDVFVVPSLQDNFPNTVLESMACGTPVVAFRTGGIPEAVRHNETGLLVPIGDVKLLREAVVELLANDDKRREKSRNCRHLALKEYRLDTQAYRYLSLYREMLAKSRPG